MEIKDYFDCEKEKLIKEISSAYDRANSQEIIVNEISASDYDLESAKRDYSYNDHKWATVKAYYSILHATKAYIRLNGVIIKNHMCTYYFLEKMAKKGMIESKYVYAFRASFENRMEADYGLTYNEKVADEAIKNADEFNKKIKTLLN